jgi:hypothetical protein
VVIQLPDTFQSPVPGMDQRVSAFSALGFSPTCGNSALGFEKLVVCIGVHPHLDCISRLEGKWSKFLPCIRRIMWLYQEKDIHTGMAQVWA